MPDHVARAPGVPEDPRHLKPAEKSRSLARVVNFYGLQIPLVQACWFELFDHIHHRGQFSVYLRLAGAKVPSIYDPTADEPMVAAR